jgi:hypothetical protein
MYRAGSLGTVAVEIPKMDLETQDAVVWTGSFWLRIGTSEGLL